MSEQRLESSACPDCGFLAKGTDALKNIAFGQIARGEGGWVILKEKQTGNWSTVGGPVPTRELARHLRMDTLSALMKDDSGSSAKPVDVDIFVGKAEQRRTADLCMHGHEWVVYSTALREGWLMLQCVECGAMGTIDDPSPEEWSDAFHAPSRPYAWRDNTRVTDRSVASPRVIRAVHGPRCDCPSERSLPENKGYERVPDGIWEHSNRLSDREKAELSDFAEFVGESDLCSRLLPAFTRFIESDTGHLCHQIIHSIVDRIETFDALGLHCSPSVVARTIREYASWETR
jgi:hypothetical protein